MAATDRRGLWLVLYILIGAGLLYAVFGRTGGAEGRLRHQLSSLQTSLEKEGSEGNLQAASQANAIAAHFADPFKLDLGSYGGSVEQRSALVRAALGYRTRYRSISVRFKDMEIQLAEDEEQADVELVAVLSAQRGQGTERQAYRLGFDWVQIEGEWRIRRGELLEVIEGLESWL